MIFNIGMHVKETDEVWESGIEADSREHALQKFLRRGYVVFMLLEGNHCKFVSTDEKLSARWWE